MSLPQPRTYWKPFSVTTSSSLPGQEYDGPVSVGPIEVGTVAEDIMVTVLARLSGIPVGIDVDSAPSVSKGLRLVDGTELIREVDGLFVVI